MVAVARYCLAERVKAEMKKLYVRSNAQFLFKVRYPSAIMVRMNRNLIQSLRNPGFKMFDTSGEEDETGELHRLTEE